MEQRLKTPDGNFIIRPFEPEDEPGVLALWREAFGRDMSYDIWRWKYRDNPFGRQIMLCLHEDATPVVMFACLPYPALCQGKRLWVSHAVDNMSHPRFRGTISGRRGLFVRTAEAFFQTYAGPGKSTFVYGFPGQRHYRLGQLLLDYMQLQGGIAYLEAETEKIRCNPKMFSGRLRTVKPDHTAFDRIMRRAAREYSFCVQRDAKFMHWRFGLHPECTYELWMLFSFAALRPKGFVAFRVQGDHADAVDMLLNPDLLEVRDFWSRLAHKLARRGIRKIRTWLPGNHILTQHLCACGFVLKPEPFGFVPSAVGKTFYSDLPFDWCTENIFYTMADGDVL